MSVAFDAVTVRSNFPALVDGAAHFDGPGGTQTPRQVADAISATLTEPLANRGVRTLAERNAEAAVREGRAALGDLLNVDPQTVIFGRSMTELTMSMARTIAKSWGPGDEVVVTKLDHDSNVRSWVIAAEHVGATVRWAEFDPATGELTPDAIASVLSPNTKLVAVTAASNLIGTIPDIPAISERVHAVGALLYVDGVHYAAHAVVDVPALGADFFGCSPYKFLGPHCGALHGCADLLAALSPDKLLPSTNEVPERYELGTLPYELMAGTAAAIEFLAEMAPGTGSTRRERLVNSMTALEEHEDALRIQMETFLTSLPGARLYSNAQRRTPTLLVKFDGHGDGEISQFLADRGVNAPASAFYAHEASIHLGLGSTGGIRIGLAPYNTVEDVERLEAALKEYFE